MSAGSVDWFVPAIAPELTAGPVPSTELEVLVETPDDQVALVDPAAWVTHHLVTIVPDRTAFDRQAARDVILERVRDGGPGDLDAFIVGVLRQILHLDRPDSELAAKCRGIGDALTLLRALR